MNINEQKTINEVQIKQGVMEGNQEAMATLLEKYSDKLDQLDQKLDELNKKFDELTGAKRTLIWLTGVVIGVAAIVTAWINGHRG